MTNQELTNYIGKIQDPTAKLSLAETGGLKSVFINPEGICEVTVTLMNKEKDERAVKVAITKLLKQDLGIPGVKIEINEFPKAAAPYKYLGIASGKGGVGKSTVTVHLARALNEVGVKTGIVDADIYGASVPFILNIKKEPVMGDENEMMIPLRGENIEVISTEFFMPDDTPLMWRGPMLNKMLTYFFNGVRWEEGTQLVLIDLPPGTGDVAIDIHKFAPKSAMLIVTTPNLAASKVAVKAGLGADQIGHEVIGVVENMSYYLNPYSQTKDYIFGQGGGNEVAKKLGVPILAEIPINYETNKQVVKDEYINLANKIKRLMEL